MLKIKQESSFMGGGSLASLFHHFLPEISIALKSRGLISGTSQVVMDRGFISRNGTWEYLPVSILLEKSEGGTGSHSFISGYTAYKTGNGLLV
jgi:hypothetical protein